MLGSYIPERSHIVDVGSPDESDFGVWQQHVTDLFGTETSPASQAKEMGERVMLHRLWDKWATVNVSPSGGKPLTGAAVVNLASNRPIRFPGLVLEQEGLALKSSDVRPIIAGVRDLNLHTECIILNSCKYLVTTVYENIYCARRSDAPSPSFGGAIIAQLPAYLVISTYEGSIGAAAKALAATELLMDQLTPRTA